MVTINIVKQIKKYNSFRLILAFNRRYNMQQGSFPLISYSFLFCSHFVLLLVCCELCIILGPKDKVEFGLFFLAPPSFLPHKICHNKLPMTGGWLRQRVVGLGTPRILGRFFISISAYVWSMVYFQMGRLVDCIPWNADLRLYLQEMWCGWPSSTVGHCGKVRLLLPCSGSFLDRWRISSVLSNKVFPSYF